MMQSRTRRRLACGSVMIALGAWGGPTEVPVAAQRPSSNIRQVRVRASQQWTATGVYVRQNDRVAFTASGEIRLSNDPDDVAQPAGSMRGRTAPGAPLRGVLAGALIGRVGRSAPFGIGNQTVPLGMPATGELFLGVNDDGFGDNAGEFTVTIRGGSNRPIRESTTQPPAGGRGVSVQASRLWTSTRLYVRQGDRVTFGASGQVRLSRNADDVSEPAGSLSREYDPGAPLPDQLRGALIGRIDDSAPFGIGNQSRPLAMPATGELFLGINDSYTGDNSGQYTVSVEGASTTRPSEGSSDSGSDGRIRVSANQQWTSTSIGVRSGQRVRFDVQGRIRIGGSRPWVGPEGHVNEPAGGSAPMPGAPLGQLLGRIDNGIPFAINGTSREIRMPDSGRLSFGVNDTWVGDNDGEFEIRVRR